MSGHPSEGALRAWLESGRPARVERHVESCERCLAHVEELSGLDGTLRDGLASATAPAADLAPRTTDRVQGRLAFHEAVSVVAELFALPWRTLDSVVDDSRLSPRVVPSGPAGDDDSLDDGERPDG